jgi:hypothetical protein
MNEQVKTDRLGVSKLDYFFSSNGWLFREQFLHDYGIDAQVEIVNDVKPTGDLIAMQIKSGQSYFLEQTDAEIVYRTDDKHIEYWYRHSLPVIIFLYHPSRDTFYWERVDEDTIINTGKGWKINIPKSQTLTVDSLDAFRNLTQPPPYIQKLNKLRLDKRWIDLVANGETVYIEYEDWINKSLPRFQIRIGCETRSDVKKETWPTIYGVGLSMEEAVSHTIPWADYELDHDAYYEYIESVWYDECYSWHDKETDTTFFTMPFDEWYKPAEGIVPVYADGEVEGYRLILSLNEIGKAFVVLDEYLAEEDLVESRVFTLDK